MEYNLPNERDRKYKSHPTYMEDKYKYIQYNYMKIMRLKEKARSMNTIILAN